MKTYTTKQLLSKAKKFNSKQAVAPLEAIAVSDFIKFLKNSKHKVVGER